MSNEQGAESGGCAGAPPLCFVVMPFGEKTDGAGTTVAFDEVYSRLIAPAVRRAGLEPIRADEEVTGGIIHKPMFERLLLCDFVVADLTFANANVFYELGIRHAVKPYSTVLIYAEGTQMPFDVQLDRAMRYALNDTGRPDHPDDVAALAGLLESAQKSARDRAADSPIYQLVEGWPATLDHQCDAFRDRVRENVRLSDRLAQAQAQGPDAVSAFERGLGRLDRVDSAIVLKLFLAYRDLKAWQALVDLAGTLPPVLATTPLVQQQLGLALNRLGDREGAAQVLRRLLDTRGPSGETYGILGRVYKDQYEDAVTGGRDSLAAGLLDKALATYLKGFETDWRNAYPGVNALTLMEVRDPDDPRREGLLPVVAYAVARRTQSEAADYWDHACELELAVLQDDQRGAKEALRRALAERHLPWQTETTAATLRRIADARRRRGQEVGWIEARAAELEP